MAFAAMKSILTKKFFKIYKSEFSIIWLWIGLAASILGAFIMMTSEVLEADSGETELIGEIDRFFIQFSESIRVHWLSDIAVDITALGSVSVVTMFVVISSVFLLLRHRYIQVAHLIVVALGSALLTRLVKGYFGRARPDGLSHLVDVQGFSYPSGHSLSSAAVYFTFAIFLCNEIRNWSGKWLIVGLALVVISLVGISRVYLGVHYFSDVLAGILLGIGWAALVGGVGSYLSIRGKQDAL